MRFFSSLLSGNLLGIRDIRGIREGGDIEGRGSGIFFVGWEFFCIFANANQTYN